MGVEEDAALRFVQILLVAGAGQGFDLVGVIQHDAVVADAADAGFGTHRRHAGLDARVAGDALLCLAGFPVVVDLLVRACAHAETPAAALVLVDQDDAVFFALVERTGRAGRHAGRIQAVVTDARQIHVEGVLELAEHILLDVVQVLVHAALGKLACQIVFPVRAPGDFFHGVAGDHRQRACGRRRLGQRRILQARIVVGEGLVVIVDLRQIRIGENVQQLRHAAAGFQLQLAVVQHPAAFPFLLVLPLLGIADTGLGLDVVEPDVFHALAVGPGVLTRHRAGVASDTFVQIEDKCELSTYFHGFLLIYPVHATINACRYRVVQRSCRSLTGMATDALVEVEDKGELGTNFHLSPLYSVSAPSRVELCFAFRQ